MNKSTKFSPEVCGRAVRMVQERRGECASLWAAMESIAPKIGCMVHTLLSSVQWYEIDTGVRDGMTTSDAQRMKEIGCDFQRTGLPKRASLAHAV